MSKRRIGKQILFIVIPLLVAIAILYNTCWAVGRKAIQETEFSEYNIYIIVQELNFTSTGWRIIGDEKGHFKEGKEDIEVILDGNQPPTILHANYGNSFLCIVEKEGERRNPTSGEMVDVYRVDEWYPVYPIHHCELDIFSKWPGSKGYLTKDEISGQ